jgi:hypothetical protein
MYPKIFMKRREYSCQDSNPSLKFRNYVGLTYNITVSASTLVYSYNYNGRVISLIVFNSMKML